MFTVHFACSGLKCPKLMGHAFYYESQSACAHSTLIQCCERTHEPKQLYEDATPPAGKSDRLQRAIAGLSSSFKYHSRSFASQPCDTDYFVLWHRETRI